MENLIIEKIESEVTRLLDKINCLEVGTAEYKDTLDAITKLQTTLNSEKKTELESNKLTIEKEKHEKDSEIKMEQLELDKAKIEMEYGFKNKQIDNDHELKNRQMDIEIEKDGNSLLNNREQREFLKDQNSVDRGYNLIKDNKEKLFEGGKIAVEVVSIVAPIVFYGIWMSRGLEFEKEGTFTSNTFKGLIGKFRPSK